jgi:hypothetical protein
MCFLAISDPFEQRMGIAFMFTATCWTFWWNIQWKRVMGFWVRPPYGLRVQFLFRAFFALCFLGTLSRFLHELHAHPLAKGDIGPTIGIAVIMCAVVTLMSGLGLSMIDRRNGKTDIRIE